MEVSESAGQAPAEVRLAGRSISPGLGMGQAWVLGDVLKGRGPPTAIGQSDVDGELVRLAHAVEEALAELGQGHRLTLVVEAKPQTV